MSVDELVDYLLNQTGEYESCMSLYTCEDGESVELNLDTSVSHYLEWIPGEGADIGLLRCQETRRVIGVRLPLYRKNLAVFHEGPLKINEGFLKDA